MRRAIALLALLIASCGEPADPSQSLDGGSPLLVGPFNAGEEEHLAKQDCVRKERGGWHISTQHCPGIEMTGAARVSGIWVVDFEESSFFPGASAVPDRNHPLRYSIELEVTEEQVGRVAGRFKAGQGGRAYLLSFVGRRTKYPWIGCEGSHNHTFVPDRLESARYMGSIAAPDPPMKPSDPRYRAWKPSGKGGVIGRLEREAFDRCNARLGGWPDNLS